MLGYTCRTQLTIVLPVGAQDNPPTIQPLKTLLDTHIRSHLAVALLVHHIRSVTSMCYVPKLLVAWTHDKYAHPTPTMHL
jgi:hypothetical protein